MYQTHLGMIDYLCKSWRIFFFWRVGLLKEEDHDREVYSFQENSTETNYVMHCNSTYKKIIKELPVIIIWNVLKYICRIYFIIFLEHLNFICNQIIILTLTVISWIIIQILTAINFFFLSKELILCNKIVFSSNKQPILYTYLCK